MMQISNQQSRPIRKRHDEQTGGRPPAARTLYGLRAWRSVCRIFADDAKLQITDPSRATRISVSLWASDNSVHCFPYNLKRGTKAAVHWRATVRSRITSERVLTEHIDVVEIRDGRIASYIEFFASHN
jgi:hypothetical protein